MAQTTAAPRTTEAAERSPEADQEAHPGVGGSPVALAMTFDDLLARDDAPGETADDLVRAVRAWRDASSDGELD